MCGVAEICMRRKGELSQQESRNLDIQEQTATSYRLHSGLTFMQGTRGCVIRENSIDKWGEAKTLARGIHMPKPLVYYPWDMDALVAILRARRE